MKGKAIMTNQSEEENLFEFGLARNETYYHDLIGNDIVWPQSPRWMIISHDVLSNLQTFIFCFGFISNLLVLLVFFKNGFALASNVSFFALAGADLYVCFIFVTWMIAGFTYSNCMASTICDWLFTFWRWSLTPSKQGLKSLGAWITTAITLERLCSIMFPLKVR